MRVQQIWRYPVKSIGGEQLTKVQASTTGLAGDRALAVRDEASGDVTWAGDFPVLMQVTAATGQDGTLWLTMPGGQRVPAADPAAAKLLSELAGHPLSFVPHELENPEAALHILTTVSMRTLAEALPETTIGVARFRPNLVLDVEGTGYPEHDWLGRRIRIGSATLRLTEGCPRCTMVNQATPSTDLDRRVLRHVARNLGNIYGIYAAVETPGEITERARVTWDY
jgi:uncharacterized protein YcbX